LPIKNISFTIQLALKAEIKNTRRIIMKKLLLALFAVMTLAACTGSYRSGNCEYDFLLHKDISISKLIGSCN
jgi:hypothetical protein